MKPDYSDLFDLLETIEQLRPKDWPPELPPEGTPGFWEAATRQEFAHRATLTEKIRLALKDGLQSVAAWTPIESWLYSRRRDWVIQIVYEAVMNHVSCSDSPQDFLMNVIVDHWRGEGAHAFWDFAMERGGKPSPETDEDIVKMMS
ncbi:MAG: hypothetical protein IKO72_08945 [Kiritimatiellae bacterium]|nr:hypothetical protein [Kiritimatiellia bacterium]